MTMLPNEQLSATDAAQSFFEYLVKHRPMVEDALVAALGAVARDDELDRYLYGPVRDFTLRGGKRTRPILCLLGAEAVGGDKECALGAGMAVELFQTAALIHDDVADESLLRRGVPCMHVSEGTGPAVNNGDAALVDVLDVILDDTRLDDATKLRVLGEVSKMERRTVEGQALDLCWGRDDRWDITVDDYMRMATLKTAHYSCATPLALGAICAGGTDAQIEALRAFGIDAGLAFQLQDDLLDLTASEDQRGKNEMGDISEGKRTLAVVWALGHAGPTERDELVRILSAHTVDLGECSRAVRIMEDCGALEHVRRTAIDLASRSKEHLSGVGLTASSRVVLESMADFFVERLR